MADDLPERTDVLIVGAGPAGLVAAAHLLAARTKPLLVDARPRIGHPLRCAEATRPDFFQAAGVAFDPTWVRWTLEGYLVLDRPRLEEELAQALGRQGAIVRSGTVVVGVGPYDGRGRTVHLVAGGTRHQVHARLVIAADGVASSVARLAGLDTRLPLAQLGSSLAYRLADARLRDARQLYLEFCPELRPFYFWVIPSGPAEANVGVGLLAVRGSQARRLLDRILARTPVVSGGRVIDTIVGCLPSAPPLAQPWADGLLVAGTAARLVNGASGEGIWYAAVSGRAAARVARRALGTSTEAAALASYRTELAPLWAALVEPLRVRARREAGDG